MSSGPTIQHDWNKVAFVAYGDKPWTKEDVVSFVLEIEERVARGGSHAADLRPRLALVRKE
jgi:hypothetical protein